MKSRKENRKNMNDYVVGIDIGERESVATYLSPTGDIIEQFSFEMNDSGYSDFKGKIPVQLRIAFETSGLAYVVYNRLKSLGYSDLTVAHPKEQTKESLIYS